MKQIDYYIESNKKLMEEKIKEYQETDAEEQEELRRLDKWIAQIDYYIRGLEDAKKYIEEEKNNE